MFYQQGDVLIECVDSLPNGKKVVPDVRGNVLAEGEVTGHYHGIEISDSIEIIEKDNVLYIGAKEDFTVTHQEHGPVTVPAGNYKVGIVKEYDHFEERAREVRD